MGGGASSLSVLWRKHVASTAQARGAALVPLQGVGWPPSSPYLSCGRTPGGPPVGACTARAPFGHRRVVRPAPSLRVLPTVQPCPRGGLRVPLPSSPLSPLSSSLCSTHVAGLTQARRKHTVWLQRWGGGFPFGAPISLWSGTSSGSHAGPCRPCLPPFGAVLVLVFSLSSSGALVCFVRGGFSFFFLHPPRSPPVSSPGTSVCPLSPPPVSPRHLLAVLAPFLGGWGRWGWGGGGRPRCPSSGVSTSQARRRHEAPHLSLCRGGGLAVWLPSSPFPPCVRSTGAPPAGACTARASFGHGSVVRPAPSLRCLPTLPLSPREGGPLFAPPFFHPPPLGGRECVGRGGGLSSSLRCTHVAGTTQARRRHEARHPSLCRGGAGMPCGSRRRPFYPALAPPVVPPLGLVRRVPSSGTVVWSVRHPLTAASLPCCVVLGGGTLFAPPPYLQPPPSGGRGCVCVGGGAIYIHIYIYISIYIYIYMA